MAVGHDPVVGDWYMTPSGDSFEVVAFESDEDSIEIQYFDGAVEALDMETWLDISARPIEPPEDWSGSMDVSREDVGTEDVPHPHSASSPLDDPDL